MVVDGDPIHGVLEARAVVGGVVVACTGEELRLDLALPRITVRAADLGAVRGDLAVWREERQRGRGGGRRRM